MLTEMLPLSHTDGVVLNADGFTAAILRNRFAQAKTGQQQMRYGGNHDRPVAKQTQPQRYGQRHASQQHGCQPPLLIAHTRIAAAVQTPVVMELISQAQTLLLVPTSNHLIAGS